MPVYNGENFIEPGIRSILAQTYEEFDLVISDNGSKDRTEEIVRCFVAEDSRVRYFRCDVNRGAGWNYEHVRSLGAGTEFYKWSAHDDVIAPTYLERCIGALDERPDATLAFSGVA